MIERLLQLLGLDIIIVFLLLTEVSGWFSVLKVGPRIADTSYVIFAFLVDEILTWILIHLLPALTVVVP